MASRLRSRKQTSTFSSLPPRKTALEILNGATPQALIIDVGLPDANGFDLYDRISSKMGRIPVVFSFGNADAGSVNDLGTGSRAVLLTKPYAFDDLLRTLQLLLEVNG